MPLARASVEEEGVADTEDDVELLSGDSEAVAKQKLMDEELEKFQELFKDFKFYLSREVPREPLVFVIRLVFFW